MRSPLTRAHPSQPSASLLCRLAPGSGFRPLRRLSHPPAKPPCRFSDQQGSWFEPTWRDGGVEPSTPSWFSSRTDGGRSTTPRAVGRCSRLSTPLAPRISHPQPPERMPSPDILTPNRHHLTFCSACSLVGAGPVSRHLLAPDADADADANGADDVIDDGCDGGDGSDSSPFLRRALGGGEAPLCAQIGANPPTLPRQFHCRGTGVLLGCQLGARWCLASSLTCDFNMIKNYTHDWLLLVAAYHASSRRWGALAPQRKTRRFTGDREFGVATASRS